MSDIAAYEFVVASGVCSKFFREITVLSCCQSFLLLWYSWREECVFFCETSLDIYITRYKKRRNCSATRGCNRHPLWNRVHMWRISCIHETLWKASFPKKGRKKKSCIESERMIRMKNITFYNCYHIVWNLIQTQMNFHDDPQLVLAVELLHLLKVGISRKLKKCTVRSFFFNQKQKYIENDKVVIIENWAAKVCTLERFEHLAVLVHQQIYGVRTPDWIVSDSKAWTAQQFFEATFVKRMLSIKLYYCQNWVSVYENSFRVGDWIVRSTQVYNNLWNPIEIDRLLVVQTLQCVRSSISNHFFKADIYKLKKNEETFLGLW